MMKRYLYIAAAVTAVDLLTKWIIVHAMSPGDMISVVPGFNLVLTYNTGIVFGLLAGHPRVMMVANVVIIVMASGAVYFLRERLLAWRLGMPIALVLGGAFGNVLDRVTRGHVVDYLDLYVGGFHWPSFNVADAAMTIGEWWFYVWVLVKCVQKARAILAERRLEQRGVS